MIADGRTPPCSLFVGEGRGGRWVGWSTNAHSSMGITKCLGRCWPPTVRSSVWHCATMSDVTEELWWRDEDAEYMRHRSSRYPGATDLETGMDAGGRSGSAMHRAGS